jgi:hypothetical protein
MNANGYGIIREQGDMFDVKPISEEEKQMIDASNKNGESVSSTVSNNGVTTENK